MCEYHFQQKRMVQSYSTPCSKTKFNGKTESYQLTIDGKGKKPVDDKDKKPVDKPAIKYKWVSNGPKTQCNTAAGEVFLASSPGKGTSLEQTVPKRNATRLPERSSWRAHQEKG